MAAQNLALCTPLKLDYRELQAFTAIRALGVFEAREMSITPDSSVRRCELLSRLFTPDGKPREGLENQQSLSSADVAALFQMTERSIRKLAADGRLPHMRTLGGGRLLYPPHEIADLYREFCSTGLKRSPKGSDSPEKYGEHPE